MSDLDSIFHRTQVEYPRDVHQDGDARVIFTPDPAHSGVYGCDGDMGDGAED